MVTRSGLQSMQAFSARQKWRMHVAPCSSSDTAPSQFLSPEDSRCGSVPGCSFLQEMSGQWQSQIWLEVSALGVLKNARTCTPCAQNAVKC